MVSFAMKKKNEVHFVKRSKVIKAFFRLDSFAYFSFKHGPKKSRKTQNEPFLV